MWKTIVATTSILFLFNSCNALKLSDAKLKEKLDEAEDVAQNALKGVWVGQCESLNEEGTEFDKQIASFSSYGITWTTATYTDSDCENIVKADTAFLSLPDLNLTPGEASVKFDATIYEYFTTFYDKVQVDDVNSQIGENLFALGRPQKVNGVAHIPSAGDFSIHTIISLDLDGKLRFGDSIIDFDGSFQESDRATSLESNYFTKLETADVDGMVGLIETGCQTLSYGFDSKLIMIQDGVHVFYADQAFSSNDGSCTDPVDTASSIRKYSWSPQGEGLYHVEVINMKEYMSSWDSERLDLYQDVCGVTVGAGEAFMVTDICNHSMIMVSDQVLYTSAYSLGLDYRFAGGGDNDGATPETRMTDLIDIGLQWKRR